MSQIPDNYSPSDVGPELDTEGFTAPDPDASRDDLRAKIKRTFAAKERPPKPEKERKITPRMPAKGFTDEIEAVYLGIGQMLEPFDPVCGGAIKGQARAAAEAWNELAKQNEAIRRFIISMLQTSAWGGLFFANMPIFMAVLMHHSPGAQKRAGEMMANMAEQYAQQNGQVPGDE